MDVAALGIEVVPVRKRGDGTKISYSSSCWEKYLAETKDAIQESIREAKGRFEMLDKDNLDEDGKPRANEDYDPADKAYAAPNWRVVAGAQGMNEIVEVSWKVGRRKKIPLFVVNGERVESLRVNQGQVVTLLTAMDAELHKEDFKTSENGKLFFDAAKEAARPKKADQQGLYEFNEETERWVKKS